MPSTLRRAYVLEYATIGWNSLEAVVALVAGITVGSVALTAFGIDSIIEVFAALVVLVELRGHAVHDEDGHTERLFLRLISGSFFALSAYVVVQSGYDLATRSRPGESVLGIVLTSLSLVFMWLLASAKHREGHRINCMPLIADSRETRLCSLLSAVTLTGLALNAAFGWWWADPIAGLGIGVLAFREGREAWTGKHPEHPVEGIRTLPSWRVFLLYGAYGLAAVALVVLAVVLSVLAIHLFVGP
jgi:divalent metal cation (Fe/Co/Zn/Cd) transporter